MASSESPLQTPPPPTLLSTAAEVETISSSDGGRGTWKHAAFHIATTIATPAAYAPLPFALASLGWPLGVFSLVGGTLVAWYSSLLIASLWGWNGEKQTTYRQLGKSIFGPWGYRSITCFQQVASLGNNIAIHIAAGSSLKAVYKYYHRDGTSTLQTFIIIFGVFELLLSQLPDIHSLRWVNALCTFSTVGFAATTIGVSIYNGKKIDRKSISYGLQGSSSSKMFSAFNALGVIAFSFGDAMLPEIQSTVKDPAKKNMYKGVSTAYGIIMLSYWQLAFSGYWAFGSDVQPYILASLTTPKWTIVMANIFAVYPSKPLNLAVYPKWTIVMLSVKFEFPSELTYPPFDQPDIWATPTYAYFEEMILSDMPSTHFRLQNSVLRITYRLVYMVFITTIAAAMPFFGDFVSICGAIGFTPLDFVFPALAFLKAGRMPKNEVLCRLVRVLNITIATWFSIIAMLGCIGAVRFIIQDLKTYKFFHDM